MKSDLALEMWDMEKDALGKGAAGCVYKATHKNSNVQAAIKVCEKEALDEDGELKEVKVWENLLHPNIVRLYSYKMTSDKLYLVTELMEGGELFDAIVKRGETVGYSEKWAQNIAEDIALALQYLHKHKVVHRDIKPENLLLSKPITDKSYEVKLADFGFADTLNKKHRKLHARLGTPGYAAPEILEDRSYGTEVDMWSFGVVLYILLCGYPPFDDEADDDEDILKGRFEFDEEDWADVSPSAKDLIQKLIHVDQKTRLTADQVLQHPWMKLPLAESKRNDKAMKRLKKYVAKKRWKKSGNTIRASIKMARLSIRKKGQSSKLLAKLKEINLDELDESDEPEKSSGAANTSL